MSSSNLVSLIYEKEAEYGKRVEPTAGTTVQTVRMTSESLSGTPDTTESAELRTDRMSSGQVVTGLTVEGDINWELAADTFFDDFFQAAMMSTWVPAETINTTVDLVPDVDDDQKAVLTLGAEFVNLIPGTLVRFTPTDSSPVTVQITTVDTPSTVFTVATSRGQAAVSETLDVILPSYVDIGTSIDGNSFLIGKSYKDVQHLETTDDHSQTYTGELVSGFNVDATYGEIMNGSYTMMGNGYKQEAPSFEQLVERAGGTVTPAGTTNPINASIDVGLVTNNDQASTYCIQSLSLTLDNGLSEQTCIGKAAPTGFTHGTAAVSISMTIYNSDTAYDIFQPAKLSQAPVSITYVAENLDGGYAFHAEAIQLSFPDPAATGQNEDTFIEAEGVGKVGENGESALRIYKL